MKILGISRKLFTLTIVLVVWANSLCTSAAAQGKKDTLLFQWNKSTKWLNITYINHYCGKCKRPCLDWSDTNAAKILILYYKEEKQGYSPMYNNGSTNLETTFAEFDSSAIANLELYEYDDNKSRYFLIQDGSITIIVKIIDSTNPPAANNPDTSSSWLFVAIILFVVALLIAVFMFFRKRRQSDLSHSMSQTSESGGIEVVEEVSEELVVGLDAVYKNRESYYMMDMQEVYGDTAVHKIFLHHTAVKKMYDFFKSLLESSDQTTETGCYFVGCWEYDDTDKQSYNISVEEIVEPGDDIVSDEFSFNFGMKIGVSLFSKLSELTSRTHRDFVHTVWMHSHPGLGLFLSSHDLIVQQQLTYSSAPNRLVAFVIDTNTPDWDMAVFTSKTNGTMNNKDELNRIYSLEELYQWSRRIHSSATGANEALTESVTVEKHMDNYYDVPVRSQGSSQKMNIYFSGRAINAIDDILYDCADKQTIGGYMVGDVGEDGSVMVEDCIRECVSDYWGLLIVDDTITDHTLSSVYIKDNPVLAVFVSRSEDEILVLARKSKDESFPTMKDATACSVKSMKEWIRRRRIYK